MYVLFNMYVILDNLLHRSHHTCISERLVYASRSVHGDVRRMNLRVRYRDLEEAEYAKWHSTVAIIERHAFYLLNSKVKILKSVTGIVFIC